MVIISEWEVAPDRARPSADTMRAFRSFPSISGVKVPLKVIPPSAFTWKDNCFIRSSSCADDTMPDKFKV